MRTSKALLIWVFARIILFELVLCTGIILYGVSHRTGQGDSATFAAPSVIHYARTLGARQTVNANLPAHLKIPKIGVDATLEDVSLTSQGDLGAPQNPANAGWYTAGPRPGDSGNAVIDGHFGYRDHIPAVFDNLHLLQPGDLIYTEDGSNNATTFVVRATQTFGPNDNATAVFKPSDGSEHLNLITCQGIWDASQKSYNTRLVVFADKLKVPAPGSGFELFTTL
jgi:LPXTG-site transpeptidase (sortase) family protein